MKKTVNGTTLWTLHLFLLNKIGVYALTPTKEDCTKKENVLVYLMDVINGISIEENEQIAFGECVAKYYK